MFRKVTAMLVALVLCCSSLGACSKETPRTLESFLESMEGIYGGEIPFEREYGGVSFSVEDATSKGASFRYENRYDVDVWYGESWNLFVSTDSGYRFVDIKIRNFAFNLMVSTVPMLQYLDFKWLYKGLKPGSYRIIISVSFPQDYGKYNPSNYVYLYADFEISK